MRIVELTFGSHLYGTDTPSSDKDYKGVELPHKKDILLGKIPKHYEHFSSGGNDSKNTCDDTDIEIFSLNEFIKLAMDGQTVAMDMLHAPDQFIIHTSDIWESIREHKHKFYSKNIESFIGYCLKQTAKYSIKGSRLSDSRNVLNWLDLHIARYGTTARLSDCDCGTFPEGEHIVWQYDTNPVSVQVCQRNLQVTCKLGYLRDIVQKYYDAYGERAKLAETNDNVDFKAVSHAFRAAYQVKELFTEGTITFPRPEREFLTKIKTASLNYKDIAPILEDLVDEVTALHKASILPEKADKVFWEDFLCFTIEEHVFKRKGDRHPILDPENQIRIFQESCRRD